MKRVAHGELKKKGSHFNEILSFWGCVIVEEVTNFLAQRTHAGDTGGCFVVGISVREKGIPIYWDYHKPREAD